MKGGNYHLHCSIIRWIGRALADAQLTASSADNYQTFESNLYAAATQQSLRGAGGRSRPHPIRRGVTARCARWCPAGRQGRSARGTGRRSQPGRKRAMIAIAQASPNSGVMTRWDAAGLQNADDKHFKERE